MGTDCVKWVGNLQQELDDAKSTLVQLNDNIRRIIGRRPERTRAVHETKKPDGERALQKSSLEISKFKKRNNDTKSVFNRLSAAPARGNGDDDANRPRLTSRVVREMPSRQEVVAAQGVDSESRARNRRIFGTLLGTLQKFCQEESRLKDKEQKKADIEKKLEEQQRQERANLRKEREALFLDRKRKQIEIKTLEMKMHRIREYDTWESNARHLKNFIRTKTKPHIYFKPRSMCKKLEKLHNDCKIALEKDMVHKREELNKELSEIENKVQLENFDSYDNLDDECMENQEDRSRNKLRMHDINFASIKQSNGYMKNKDRKSGQTEPTLSSRVVVVTTQKDRDSY